MLKSNKYTDKNRILQSYLLISWVLIPLLIFQLIAHAFSIYKLPIYQIYLIGFGLFGLISFVVLRNNKKLRNNFYNIQIIFLFILIGLEFLWYLNDPSPRQLLSLLLGITVTGVALLKPKNAILFFIGSISLLLLINYIKDYPVFQFVNYFIISAVCVVSFNLWRYNILQSLKLSEQNFRHIFEKSLAGIYKISFDGIIIEANDSFANLLGFSKASDLINKNIKTFYFDVSNRESYLKELKEKNHLSNYITALKNKKGEKIIVNNNVFLLNENNTLIISGTVIDITELYETSQKLKTSEQKYKLLFEESTNGIALINLEDLKVIEANNNTALFFNTTKEYILSNTIDKIIKVNNKSKIIEFFKNETNKKIEVEVVNDKDQSIRYLTLSKIELYIENKNIIQVIISDITNQKLKEKELIENQKSFKNVVENAPSSILIITNHKVVYANPLAKTIFLNDDIINTDISSIFNQQQLIIINKSIKEIDAPQKSYNEITFKHIGKTQKFSVQAVKVSFENKDSILLLFRDISIEFEYNIQKLRAELAENLNIKLEKEINKRIDIEKKLIESKKFTDNILDSSIDMIIATDLSERIISINQAALNRFGYQYNDIISKPVNLIYAPTFNPNYIFNEIREKGKFVGEVENIDATGYIFKSFLTATAIQDDKGMTIGFMGISRDLSEIEEIKKIISSQSSLIDTLFQNESDIYIWTMNQNLELLSFNKGTNNYFKKLKGKDLIIGNNFIDQIKDNIRPQYLQSTIELYKKALRGEKVQFDALMEDEQKNKYWIDVHLTPIVLEDGSIDEIICLGSDITEKKHRLQLIKERELNIRAMINAIPDLLIKLNSKGTVLDYEVNSKEQLNILKHFYKNTDSLIGTNIKTVYKDHQKFYNKILSFIKKTIEHNKVYTQNFNYLYKSKQLYFEARYSKISNDEVIVVIRNKTEEVENENKLIESVKEKEILLKEVHHRVKNNLQIINSILNLQSSYLTDPKILEIITESQNRIRSMSYIHESLYQTKNFSSINFKDYIDNLITNLVYSYRVGSNVIINKDIQDIDLPLDYAIPCGLILNELVTNALKYAYPNNKKGMVNISILKNNENLIEMYIADNGIGLPKDFSIESTETLGLSLVHTLVDQIDGKLSVKNEVGTKFLIIFEVKQS
jgi:PAS domain S-box-containing protein